LPCRDVARLDAKQEQTMVSQRRNFTIWGDVEITTTTTATTTITATSKP